MNATGVYTCKLSHVTINRMMTRSCVRDREARKHTSMHVLEKSEPVIKCDDAIVIERLGCCDSEAMTTTMEAILNRDQRTTMHRVFDRSIEPDTVLSLTVAGGKSTGAASTRCRPEITRVNLHPVPNTRTWGNDLRTYSKVSSDDPFLVSRSRYNRRISSTRFNTTVFPLLSKFLIMNHLIFINGSRDVYILLSFLLPITIIEIILLLLQLLFF